MTVSELIEQLKALPGDIEVQVVTGGWGDPVDIVGVTRGTWSPDVETAGDGQDDEIEKTFLGDGAGTIAVIATW
jgi:hypothetical protein